MKTIKGIRGPACKIPVPSRILPSLLAVAAFAAPAGAQPEGPGAVLTEAEVVERALARPALGDAIDGSVDVARAESIREGLWPNPSLSYSRERIDGTGETTEDELWLSQRLEISGRRGLRSSAAERRAEAVREQGRARRARVAAAVRLRFYALLRLQGHRETAGGLVGRLEAALETVSRRESAGDASAYDRRRLERELAGARAHLATLEAGRARAWASLAAMIGDERDAGAPWPRVAGTLLPDPPPRRRTLVQRLAARPDLVALERVAAAAKLEGDAASRWWVPAIDLGGGYKSIDLGTERSQGFLAMASITLPVFDRRQDESLRARAEHRRARGERDLALAEARAETRGLWAEAEQLQAAARRFRQDTEDASAALVRTAESGYRGGELGVLELLDAYRGARQDADRALDLEFRARRARIELELRSGGYAP